MDAKEIKTLLKNAREAIRKKEFKEALKHCKAVLSEDSNNYTALVFIAVAAEGLEQFDQALKAYKRAIEADPAQVLAWQGLCSYYEKNRREEYTQDQTDTYLRLVHFYDNDKDKRLDVLLKLEDLVVRSRDQSRLDKVIELHKAAVRDEGDGLKKTQLQKSLVKLLMLSQVDTSSEVEQLCREMLYRTQEYTLSTEDIISTYLPLLIKRNPGDIKDECLRLQEKFPQSPRALEHVLIIQLDNKIGCLKFKDCKEVEEKLQSFLALECGTQPEAVTAAKGFMDLCKKNFTEARNSLSKVSETSMLVCVPYLLAVACQHLHRYEETVRFCLRGLTLLEMKDRVMTVPSSEATKAFQILRVMALNHLADKQSLTNAIEILEKELQGTDEITALKGQMYLKLGDVEKAKICLVGDSVNNIVLEGLIAIQEDHVEQAVDSFQTAIAQEPDTVAYQVLLAKCLWRLEDRKQDCFMLLLKAAKQDPYNSETFLFLGHYYNTVAGDETRAGKCYQKAYDLDPRNDEAGEALCDLLNKTGEEDKAYTMLLDVTQRASSGCAKWAWLRLGLYQVKHEDPSVAIASFQSALRADPKDHHVWECLGEAYLARGSYTASLKAFTRSSELNPDSVYCLFQIASIKQTLGTYTEAVEEYSLILNKSPNYVPALKGIGETYVLIARSLLSKFFDGRARDTCQLAVQHLFRAVSSRPDLSCLWKLIGDACTMLHVLPAEHFRFEKPDGSVMNKMETLELGGRCYIRALKILQECSSLWHDLGVNYIHQSQASSGDGAVSLAERSVQALKKAIQLEPTNHKHWTALGYVACLKVYNKPDLAQHCFIKSIQAEHNNVIAWTNLAALYLSRDNVKLSHEAFKIAQSLEPSYVSCWIGQAIIAEVVGHEDAMDLFRHTTELGNHIEGALGYGHWVCTMLQHSERKDSYIYTYAIEQMGAVPAACDALARYTERVKTNAVAYNMHGLLLERQGLYRTAAQQFSRAKDLLDKQEGQQQVLHDVTCNLARALLKAGDVREALSVYQKIADDCGFVDVCQFALALYKMQGLAFQSSQAYTKALEMATSDLEKAQVLTAVAMALYKHGDADNTKINLFHSSQSSQPSVQGIKALSAFGLLQSDVTLAEAALNELSFLKDDKHHLYDVTVLRVGVDLLKGNMIGIKCHLQKLLHNDPGQPELWHLLSLIMLKFFPDLTPAGASAARTCLAMELHKSKKSYRLLVSGELGSGSHGNPQQSHNAFRTAQVAVLMFPEEAENWLNLIGCVHAEAVLRGDWERRCALFKHEFMLLNHMLSQDISVTQKLWCMKQRIVCAVQANMISELMECLDDLVTHFGSEADVKQLFDVFRNVLQGNHGGLLTLLSKQSLLYYWQVAMEMYVGAGLMTEVDHVFEQCMRNSSESEKFVLMLKMAYISFHMVLSGEGNMARAVDLFKQTTDQLLMADPQCSAVLLMQAVLNMRDNTRLAKHLLQRVLEVKVTGSRGHDLSIARQALIHILVTSKKDPELVQRLMEDATLAQDTPTLQYCSTLNMETPESQ